MRYEPRIANCRFAGGYHANRDHARTGQTMVKVAAALAAVVSLALTALAMLAGKLAEWIYIRLSR